MLDISVKQELQNGWFMWYCGKITVYCTVHIPTDLFLNLKYPNTQC